MRNGFALIVILSLLGVLSFIAVLLIGVSSQNLKLSSTNILRTRSIIVAQSGFDFALKKYQENLVFFDQGIIVKTLGSGTFTNNGDQFSTFVKDFSGKININDGLNAGMLTEPFEYLANAIDPYPYNSLKDPVNGRYPDVVKKIHALSGLINLRLRRLLNSYGDVHRFVDHVFDDDYENIENFYQAPLPTPTFSISGTNSSDGRRGDPMAYYDASFKTDSQQNTGLGDQIILERPQSGYQNLTEVEEIVNSWAITESVNLSSQYLGFKSFFDLIKDDLTVSSFEDNHFTHITDETVIGYYQSENEANDERLGDFKPNDLQLNPTPFLLFELKKHPVALINLNQASFHVRAAIFYSPTNVSYSCESATTIPPYLIDSNRPQGEFLKTNTSVEAMNSSLSIGVIGPLFPSSLAYMENGHPQKGRASHLMSLRDAMSLALYYEKYIDPKKSEYTPIYNFDDFLDFIRDYEASSEIPYERVFNSSPHLLNNDFNAGNLFYVSEFIDQGIFTQDYVSRTLPHLLSCVRRIPSWYGAPSALQSPYIAVKPDYEDENNYGYQDGYLCRQGYVKVEDFVWRLFHPKVCFLSTGLSYVEATGEILDAANNLIASKTIGANVRFFKTNYYRSQDEFDQITVTSATHPSDPEVTHSDIKIGPETKIDGKMRNFLGVVGLHDYNQDLDDDPFMKWNGIGYRPQIVMNFTHDPNDNPPKLGFENESIASISPDLRNNIFLPETWAQTDAGAYFKMMSGYNNYIMEGGDAEQFYGTYGMGFYDNSDLSPFNGVRLSAAQQGKFSSRAFEDTLYWRLDDWLANGSAGKTFSRGIMTFWFRMPSGYDYPTQVKTSDQDTFFSESFTQVLVNLNVWEKYQFNDLGHDAERPVSITVGLKKNKIFARYDSGGEHHDGSVTSFYKGPSPFTNLTISFYNDSLSRQSDFLGLWNELVSPNYPSYRQIAHRCLEASVSLDNLAESGPGSWQRASVFWNLYWNNNSDMEFEDQLFVYLHNTSNAQENVKYSHSVKYAPVEYNPFTNPSDTHYDYPESPGFIFPFNSTMLLSLGNIHSRDLGSYSLFDYLDAEQSAFDTHTNQTNIYTPNWFLNSCLDNFRLWMGPQKLPMNEVIPDEYFDADFISSINSTNIYSALRYKIIHQNHGFEETVEPKWVIDPGIETGSLVYSIGTRVYYPPDSQGNVPYVFFSASNDYANGTPLSPSVISKNEQDLIFDHAFASANFRLFCQYKAFKPSFDGNQNNREAEPLIYFDEDHWTCIPWVKEISIRYQPSGEVQILDWEK